MTERDPQPLSRAPTSRSPTSRSDERRAQRADAASHRRLRPARFDDLGLKRALSDRLLPGLVAAMAFLAALALAGFVAANTLGARWQAGAGSSLTVQVPQPGAPSGRETDAADARGPNRRDAVVALLHATDWIGQVHALDDAELSDLLRPWPGQRGGGNEPAAARGDPGAPGARPSGHCHTATGPGGAAAAAGRRGTGHADGKPGCLGGPAGGPGPQPAGVQRARPDRGGGGRRRGDRRGHAGRAGGTPPGDRDRARAWGHRPLHRRPVRRPGNPDGGVGRGDRRAGRPAGAAGTGGARSPVQRRPGYAGRRVRPHARACGLAAGTARRPVGGAAVPARRRRCPSAG